MELNMATRDDRPEANTRLRFVNVSEAFFGIKLTDEPFKASHPIPWIPLVGEWLANAGFKMDDPVEITVSNGRIVILTMEHCE
jgi:hypothetical protein